MTGAIWNTSRTLAETCPDRSHRRAMLARIDRNERNARRSKTEPFQMNWQPEPGRVPYAGRDDESEQLAT